MRTSVRDHIPLEQGLRLNHLRYHSVKGLKVRDHIPLEQGLRLPAGELRRPLLLSETIFH